MIWRVTDSLFCAKPYSAIKTEAFPAGEASVLFCFLEIYAIAASNRSRSVCVSYLRCESDGSYMIHNSWLAELRLEHLGGIRGADSHEEYEIRSVATYGITRLIILGKSFFIEEATKLTSALNQTLPTPSSSGRGKFVDERILANLCRARVIPACEHAYNRPWTSHWVRRAWRTSYSPDALRANHACYARQMF